MFLSHRVAICLHIGHVIDFLQGLITVVIHLHQVCSGKTIVVLLLGYLRRQTIDE